ncbi:unnamed protein product [Trichogramma brassicae]|uniref:Uncharacterized protein n=1 Tax=Trichogramma brassicae TaxID=86971 RepID=A0A6H5J1J1_9HYME|nr:unnamed protein product [Trichogramma brassicae]
MYATSLTLTVATAHRKLRFVVRTSGARAQRVTTRQLYSVDVTSPDVSPPRESRGNVGPPHRGHYLSAFGATPSPGKGYTASSRFYAFIEERPHPRNKQLPMEALPTTPSPTPSRKSVNPRTMETLVDTMLKKRSATKNLKKLSTQPTLNTPRIAPCKRKRTRTNNVCDNSAVGRKSVVALRRRGRSPGVALPQSVGRYKTHTRIRRS